MNWDFKYVHVPQFYFPQYTYTSVDKEVIQNDEWKKVVWDYGVYNLQKNAFKSLKVQIWFSHDLQKFQFSSSLLPYFHTYD